MEIKQVQLLLDNSVPLIFTVYPAHLQLGFNLEISRSGDIEPTVLKTARGGVRLFKSLDAVWSLVAMDWKQTFSVSPRV